MEKLKERFSPENKEDQPQEHSAESESNANGHKSDEQLKEITSILKCDFTHNTQINIRCLRFIADNYLFFELLDFDKNFHKKILLYFYLY